MHSAVSKTHFIGPRAGSQLDVLDHEVGSGADADVPGHQVWVLPLHPPGVRLQARHRALEPVPRDRLKVLTLPLKVLVHFLVRALQCEILTKWLLANDKFLHENFKLHTKASMLWADVGPKLWAPPNLLILRTLWQPPPGGVPSPSLPCPPRRQRVGRNRRPPTQTQAPW